MVHLGQHEVHLDDAPSLALQLLGFLPALFRHAIITPLRLLFMNAIPWLAISVYASVPWLASNIYYSLAYVAVHIWAVLRISLIPILYPLRLFLVRPALAVLAILFQLRYLLGFVSFALFLGVGFGLLSSYVVRSTGRNDSSNTTKAQKTAQYQIIKAAPDEQPKMQGALYKEPIEEVKRKKGDRVNEFWAKEEEMRRSDRKERQQPATGGDRDRFGQAMSRLAERRRTVR